MTTLLFIFTWFHYCCCKILYLFIYFSTLSLSVVGYRNFSVCNILKLSTKKEKNECRKFIATNIFEPVLLCFAVISDFCCFNLTKYIRTWIVSYYNKTFFCLVTHSTKGNLVRAVLFSIVNVSL